MIDDNEDRDILPLSTCGGTLRGSKRSSRSVLELFRLPFKTVDLASAPSLEMTTHPLITLAMFRHT